MISVKLQEADLLRFYGFLHTLPESVHKNKFIYVLEQAILSSLLKGEPSEAEMALVKKWLAEQEKKLAKLSTESISEGDIEIQK